MQDRKVAVHERSSLTFQVRFIIVIIPSMTYPGTGGKNLLTDPQMLTDRPAMFNRDLINADGLASGEI